LNKKTRHSKRHVIVVLEMFLIRRKTKRDGPKQEN